MSVSELASNRYSSLAAHVGKFTHQDHVSTLAKQPYGKQRARCSEMTALQNVRLSVSPFTMLGRALEAQSHSRKCVQHLMLRLESFKRLPTAGNDLRFLWALSGEEGDSKALTVAREMVLNGLRSNLTLRTDEWVENSIQYGSEIIVTRRSLCLGARAIIESTPSTLFDGLTDAAFLIGIWAAERYSGEMRKAPLPYHQFTYTS